MGDAHDQGQGGAAGKGNGRGKGRLKRAGDEFFGDAQLIAGMGGQRVLGGELDRDLVGKLVVKPALYIDMRQLGQFGVTVFLQFAPLLVQLGFLHIGL
jgi:hypothetical protein